VTRARLATVASVAAVVVVVALPLRGMLRSQGPPMEEGFMLVFPELVLDGKVPHRDFLHLYGPGSLWVLAAWYWLLGVTLEVQRLFGLLQLAGLGAAAFLLARPWGRSAAVAVASVAVVVTISASGLVALAWVGALALGLFAIVAVQRARVATDAATGRRFAVLAGALAAGALLFRPDLVVAVGLALGAVALALDAPRRRALALALGVGLTPYLLLVAWAGPANTLRGLVVEPVVDLRPGRRLPIPPSGDTYAGWNQGFADLVPLRWPDTPFDGPMQLRLWFFGLLGVVALLAGVAWWRLRARPRADAAWRLAAVAAFSAGILPQALQRADSTHLGWAGAVPMAFVPVAVAELLRSRVTRPVVRNVLGAGAIVLAMFLVAPFFTLRPYVDYSAQTFGRHRTAFEVERGSRRYYYGRDDVARGSQRLLDEIGTWARAGDRLFVGNVDLRKTPYSDAWLYYMLPELEPATHYIEMDPGVANADDSGLDDDLASADVAILTSSFDGFHEPNGSRDLGSTAPVTVLEEQFCEVATYEGGIELYVACSHLDRGGNRVDGDPLR
jgi:hypothetical protein